MVTGISIDNEEMRKQLQGILTAVLMYRLGIKEITVDIDDVKAIEHTFGSAVLDLLVKPDPVSKTVSFKLERAQ